MPRYDLGEPEMQALITYLNSLSADISPGADDTSIRFATVVLESVNVSDKAAMLEVLRKHIDNHNAQTRPYVKRSNSGPFYKSEMYSAYRQLQLDIWELKGQPDTWNSQLNEYYKKQPVFALLGGIVKQSWAPIHAFCEENKIPSIFPVTDFPVVSATDWYTYYFSKGVYQQGESAAKYLKYSYPQKENTTVVQIVDENKSSQLYAKGFKQAWLRDSKSKLTEFDYSQLPDLDGLAEMKSDSEEIIWVLWLDDTKKLLELIDTLNTSTEKANVFITSWGLVKENMPYVDESLAGQLLLTFPYSMPDELSQKTLRLKQWLNLSGLPSRNLIIEDKMYFLGWMLSAVLKKMGNEIYRDYFLENFEMMQEQTRSIVHYPRVSFAQGQRFVAKGSYIVQHDAQTNTLKKLSDWSSY